MKKFLLFLFLLQVPIMYCYGQIDIDLSGNGRIIQSSVTLGSVLAVVLSWERNKSIAWAILHGLLGWLYVIYFAITRKPEERFKG